MPYLPCMAIYAHLSGVLNARNRFILSAGGADPAQHLDPGRGAAGPHAAARRPSPPPGACSPPGSPRRRCSGGACASRARRVDWRWPRLTPEIRQLIVLAMPGAIAASATQINIFVSGILVSPSTARAPGWRCATGSISCRWAWSAWPSAWPCCRGCRGRCTPATTTGAQARHGRGDHLLHGPDPAGGGGPGRHALLPDRRPLHPRRSSTPSTPTQTAAALLQYGWGVPAFVLAQLTRRAFFARQDTAHADALRPGLGGGEHRRSASPCSTSSACRASPPPPAWPPG